MARGLRVTYACSLQIFDVSQKLICIVTIETIVYDGACFFLSLQRRFYIWWMGYLTTLSVAQYVRHGTVSDQSIINWTVYKCMHCHIVFGRCDSELDAYIVQEILTLSQLKAPTVFFGKYIVLKFILKVCPVPQKKRCVLHKGKNAELKTNAHYVQKISVWKNIPYSKAAVGR